MDILDTDAYDRRQRRNTSCVLFVCLLPFFATAALYFYLWIPESAPSLLAAGVKSAPVLSLALMVLSYNGGTSLLGVAGGLLLSAGGDSCLIWPGLFLHGMGCFALAHLLYSLSFLSSRYTPHSYPSSGVYILYLLQWGITGAAYVYLLPFLQKSPEPNVFVPAVGAYAFLIVVMATLGARTRRPLVMLGGLVFMASDLTLALQHFKVIESLEYGRHIVMATYYLAQLLIAVGDVKATLAEESSEFSKWKRS
ncbi:lysoplasmalogenase [Salminus brasiliensis]|uniref:lysoplasmalogenase n=1 Tax=Salminus brasiliensis TaxID=930266 RepID=UPI003B831BF7